MVFVNHLAEFVILFIHPSVGVTGLEPAASCTPCRRSGQLSYTPAERWIGFSHKNTYLRITQTHCQNQLFLYNRRKRPQKGFLKI